MPNSTISYLWRDKGATDGFQTGISLHSHTNQSKETLDFVVKICSEHPMVRKMVGLIEQRSQERHGIPVNFEAAYWTPPLTPKQAFDLESRQIERLGLDAMVSISDHDTIGAPMMLRSLESSRETPISVEWSAPYGGEQSFHLGVHNLPPAKATDWMATFAEYTANPANGRLTEILSALDREPDVLVVFNHPIWDLYMIGKEKHQYLVNEFLQKSGNYLHALELNGLRHWEENRAVRHLAEQWNMLLVSGGDRHGVEPNANIQLTNAASFTEFVHEIRREQRSNMLFMPQYAEPWKHRMLLSTLDAVRYFPEFPAGSRHWDERAYHPDASGVIRPLCEIWPRGRAPRVFAALIGMVQLMGRNPVSGGLRYAWSDSNQLRLVLGEGEG